MPKPFRLAIAQAPADLDGVAERLRWLEDQLDSLAGQGVDLILLPELFACGYAIGDLLRQRAEPQNGPLQAALAQLARSHQMALHCGYAEQDGTDIYNSAMCLGPDGALIGHHRKLAIPPGSERSYFTPGAGCRLFSYRGLKIATLICYDAEFAETARHVAELGADLILVPTALGAQWGWVARSMIPTRGYENGVFLAYANSAGQQNGMTFLGESFIAAPDGIELARAGARPEILLADLDPERVRAAQNRLPYLRERGSLRL